jgi:hypothetical protein
MMLSPPKAEEECQGFHRLPTPPLLSIAMPMIMIPRRTMILNSRRTFDSNMGYVICWLQFTYVHGGKL